MDATEVPVRRFSATNTLQQPVFLFDPDSGSLSGPLTGSSACGWLIDNECVLSGARHAVFFERGDRFISIGNHLFRAKDKSLKMSHRKGVFTSRFTISNSRDSDSITYITPWWRYLWDDGSHTDLQFPLEYFSRRWAEENSS